MSNKQLARGIFAEFGSAENPFQSPNGMEENLRTIDDHLALTTISPPLIRAQWAPHGFASDGDGQIFVDGHYAVFNGGSWRSYAPRLGVRATLKNVSDGWVNTGTGWEQNSIVSAQALAQSAESLIEPFVQQAESAADRGDDAAVRAEAAANLAQASSATIWRTTYAELHAVMAGNPPSVPAKPANTPGVVVGDPDDLKNGAYLWDGVNLEKTPLQAADKAALDALTNEVKDLGFSLMTGPFTGTDGIRYLFGVVDEVLRQSIGVDVEGSPSLAGMLLQKLADADANAVFGVADILGALPFTMNHRGDALMGQFAIETWDDSEMPFPFSILDRYGQALAYSLKDGTVVLPSLLLGDVIDPNKPIVLAILRNQRTDFMHIVIYGQSLSRGATSGPNAITTVQPYNNVTFLSGVLGRPPFETDYSGFKPLTEAYLEPTQNEAETPTSTIANGLVASRVAAGDDADDWVFVGTAPGQGGQSISELSKGTLKWDRMLDQFRAALTLAAAQGQSYSVWGMAWTQGEDNYEQNPATGEDWTSLEYYTLLRKLVVDFGEDVHAITKQEFQPPISVSQTCAHRRYGRDHNNVAIAQWLAARDDPSISMACPIYHIPHNTDALHLTGDSYIQLGKYHERAMAKMAFDGEKFAPTWPTAVLWQGKVIDITFNVPVGSLAFDTALVAAAPNMGFDIWVGQTQIAAAIASVSIVGRDRVRIILADEPDPDAILTYARGRVGDPAKGGPTDGPRGNLRDSAGTADNYQDSQGVTRYLHNWCVMFEYSYAKGAF